MQVRPQGQRYADPRRSRKRTEETRSAGRKKALPVLQALISSYRKIQKGTPKKEFLFFVSALGSFARWAPSLFSWTEAGRGPAPSLRLPALRAESGTAECGPAFSRGQGQSVLVAVQRRKRWSCGARNIHQSGICWLRQCSAPPSRMMSKQSMVSTFRLGNAAPIRSQARASRRSSR